MPAASSSSQKEATIFITLIVFIITALVLLAIFDLLKPLFILLVILVVLVVVYSRSSRFLVLLREYERIVVFRWGKFKKVAGPGWVFLLPFAESYEKLDLRIQTADIKEQEVVTNDNIKLKIDAILYIKVEDPRSAILNVRNYRESAISNIQASLRAVVGQMTLSGVIANIEKINDLLRKNAQEVATEWGVGIEKTEIQSVTLPIGVQEAMHKLKEAEQRKFAIKEIAAGRRMLIDEIQAAAGKLTDPTLQYMYLKSLEKIAEGKSSKIIFPMELSRLASAFAAKLGGISYEKAEEKVIGRYKELAKTGKPRETIIQDLKRELGIKETIPLVRAKPIPKKAAKIAPKPKKKAKKPKTKPKKRKR